MKKASLRLLLPLLLVALSLPFFAAAQSGNGNIKGQITDTDGTTLPGASVSIKGTTRGVTTDLSGNFELLSVKAGKYTLVINYMGYKESQVEVEVKAGQTATNDVKLESTMVSLKGVTMTSVREGQGKALNQQRNADNIKQVISADLIGRYPDLNVAEAMQRLPGVTIGRNTSGEGSTVQLRGTPGNFTNINVNGEQIMGTQEGGQRNAELDVIPVNVLASMEVVKTLTPDLDGDAIAGAINMKSPTATSLKTKFTLDAGLGYNDLRGSLNGIGNVTAGKRFFANAQNPNGRLGVMVTGSWYRTKNGYDDQRSEVWQAKDFGDGKGQIYFPTDVRLLYVENLRTRRGASATIDYNFSPVTNIVANVMYSDHFNELTRYRKRTRMQTANTTYNQTTGLYTTTRGRGYNEIKAATEDNTNLNFNISGETKIGRVKLDAGVFMSNSSFENISGTYNFITGNIALEIADIHSDFLKPGGVDWKNNASLYTYNTVERDYWNTEGKNAVGRINASLPYKIGKNSATFQTGFKVKRMHNSRWRPETALVSNYSGVAADGRLTNFTGKPEVSADLLDGNNNFGLGADRDKTIAFFENNQNTRFTQDMAGTRKMIDTYFYDAVETVTSGYVMNRIQFNRFMLLGGLRVEKTDVDYQGNIVAEDANGVWLSTTRTRKQTDYVRFLPNIQGKYDLNKSSLIRAALTYGYSRPNFVDLVPGRVTSILSQTVTDGNPELKPAFATNVDLMYEKYLSNLGILSAGLFYKKVEKFQYASVTTIEGDEFENADLYQGWRLFRTLNGDAADVFGLELNAQANLTFLPGALKGISILANYTYTHSNADAQFRKDIRLPGQATHTANGSLSFAYKGFSIQGNVNYNGSYTVSLGGDDDQDVIRAARVQIDANTSYRISKRFTVYAEAQNLTNAPQIEYFGERNRIYRNQYYSFWGRAGVKFRF